MKALLRRIAAKIRPAIGNIPKSAGRRPTKEIWKALAHARGVLANHFGGKVWLRHSGYSRNPGFSEDHAESSSGTKKRKVIEFLWDFSFSRYLIPEAIEQNDYNRIVGGKFMLLFVAESELGTPTEICRDLLKLLEARAPIKCLIYPKPKRPNQHEALRQRFVRVMSVHELFVPPQVGWLFIALDCDSDPVSCEFFTMSDDLNSIVALQDGPIIRAQGP